MPTVAFQVEGLDEILKQGTVGTIVPQHDVEALAKGIDDYLQHPEWAAEHAAAAQQHAADNWDISVMVDRLRQIYHKVAQELGQ